MQEENIYLSDLGDDDLISVKDNLYKVVKLKQGFDALMQSIDSYLCAILGSHGASRLGLVKIECSRRGIASYNLISQFTQHGFTYKFVKLGYSGWQTGLIKLSVNVYLSLNQSEIEDTDFISSYDITSLNFFDDEDILSFTEDFFCKSKSLKEIFNKCFEDEGFHNHCLSSLFQNMYPLGDSKKLFTHGLVMKVLRTNLGRWDNMTLRIKFILESKNNFDQETQQISQSSPLDEIRKNII